MSVRQCEYSIGNIFEIHIAICIYYSLYPFVRRRRSSKETTLGMIRMQLMLLGIGV